jgi:ubiquinone/menaquinone biosynthesis C-methylase UbiE
MAETSYIHGTHAEEQERLARLNALTNQAFVEYLEIGSSDTVLEVGSGLGILAAEVAKCVPDGEVVGIEYSPDQLAAVRVSAPNLRFHQGDAHDLPFTEGSFDVVYCRYLLEHVADPLQVLREMHRVLRPGGRAFVQENNVLVHYFDPDTPLFDHVWRRFVELQRRLGGDAMVGKRLFALFREAGFRDVDLSLQPEFHWVGKPTFRPWVENLIGNIVGAEAKLVEHGLASSAEIRQAEAELRALMAREDASALFYWNRAKGVK